MPDTSRLFFALWPDDETRQTLARLSQSISAKGFKWVPPHNLHVTLVFLGTVNADTELLITRSAATITGQPFTLIFDRLSYWSRSGILCLTSTQPAPNGERIPTEAISPRLTGGTIAEAEMLVSALTTAAADCGLHTDTRPYTPHITLARHARYLPDLKIEPIAWRADAFCLVESCSEQDGVRYKVIQQWPFIKPTVNPDR